ncbi:MAG: signal peptidase II [Bradymonadaceae bacterium]
MSRGATFKYGVFVAIVVAGVALDQWTKWYASQRLATTHPGVIEHSMTVTVPESADDKRLEEFLRDELAWNTKSEVAKMARYQVRTPDGKRLGPDSTLEAGQKIEILNRRVTVVEDWWVFEYTVNPGAAFGLLSDTDSPWRLPFFIVVSALALGIIVFILRGTPPDRKLFITSLSMIGAGATGNFIDRIRWGEVVDFIVWKYTTAGGEVYRWPTFNIADSFITVGVVLMLIEIWRDGVVEEPEGD